MTNITEKSNSQPAQKPAPGTLFSNRCAIQCGTFSVPPYNPHTDTLTQKIIRLVNYTEDGIEQFVNIEAFPSVGLPTTTDLTYYLALQKLLDEDYKYLRTSDDRIYFSGYDLFNKIGISDGKANYERLKIWGQRMKETAIRFFENEDRKKVFGSFGIFQEFIIEGTTLEDNSVASESWLRLTKWELDNRLTKPLIPIDFSTYLKIKDKKAQLLIPHLQVWLYASRNSNVFRKNYREICSLLGLKPHRHHSDAIRQFKKTFELLIAEQYIKRARIYESGANGQFVVEMAHGEKFFRDLKMFFVIEGGGGEVGTAAGGEDTPPEVGADDLKLLPETNAGAELTLEQTDALEKLIAKEIDEKDATAIVLKREPIEVKLIIRYCEHLFSQQPKKYKSKRGYLFTLLKDEKFKVPESFVEEDGLREEKRREITERLSREAETDREGEKLDWLKAQYEDFCFREGSLLAADYSQFVESFAQGKSIWQQLQTKIRKSLNANIFQSWFEPIRFAGFDEDSLTLHVVSNQVGAEWIQAYYGAAITDALASLSLSDLQIAWIIRDEHPEDEADESFFYRLLMIEKYRQNDGMTFETFYQENQSELDDRFEKIQEQS